MRQSIMHFLVVFILAVIFAVPQNASGQRDPVDVVFMTTPFGSHMYATGAAAEQVFRTANSWVNIQHQETPGAMYMYRYMVENREKMKNDEVPYTVVVGAPAVATFLAEGRPPFKKYPWPTVRTLVPNPSVMGVYATFNPKIQSLEDLAGKQVCTGERSRPFQGILLDKPLFSILGIYDKIQWSFLGSVGCKDAFLNNAVDVVPLRFMGKMEVNEEGMFVTHRVSGGPATLEILNSGRQLHFIGMKPKILAQTKKIPGALRQYPIIFKKNAFEGLDRDLYGRAGPNCFLADASLPEDVAMEIARVWYEYRDEFSKYADFMNFMPNTPYPVGADESQVHPGILKFMQEMDLPIPKTTY